MLAYISKTNLHVTFISNIDSMATHTIYIMDIFVKILATAKI